ncbi:hypothetical protein A3Q56_04521 [Intoshia linei]|uniref:EGF-like domain-containing protein n=1 Tax=Intoshia linei TaxID=1819745 RepID=A0A177B0U4_9BILA|nr:hypothetical protein A3Q56_04521 [Intoshia linei]
MYCTCDFFSKNRITMLHRCRYYDSKSQYIKNISIDRYRHLCMKNDNYSIIHEICQEVGHLKDIHQQIIYNTQFLKKNEAPLFLRPQGVIFLIFSNLSDNNIKCDCNLLKLKEKTKNNSNFWKNIHCFNPHQNELNNLWDISSYQLRCKRNVLSNQNFCCTEKKETVCPEYCRCYKDTLDCGNNKLTKLPYIWPNYVTNLIFSNNLIKQIHFNDDAISKRLLENIRKIDVSKNNINDINNNDLKEFTSLELLYIFKKQQLNEYTDYCSKIFKKSNSNITRKQSMEFESKQFLQFIKLNKLEPGIARCNSPEYLRNVRLIDVNFDQCDKSTKCNCINGTCIYNYIKEEYYCKCLENFYGLNCRYFIKKCHFPCNDKCYTIKNFEYLDERLDQCLCAKNYICPYQLTPILDSEIKRFSKNLNKKKGHTNNVNKFCSGCINGICVDEKVCQCYIGFHGKHCQYPDAFHIITNKMGYVGLSFKIDRILKPLMSAQKYKTINIQFSFDTLTINGILFYMSIIPQHKYNTHIYTQKRSIFESTYLAIEIYQKQLRICGSDSIVYLKNRIYLDQFYQIKLAVDFNLNKINISLYDNKNSILNKTEFNIFNTMFESKIKSNKYIMNAFVGGISDYERKSLIHSWTFKQKNSLQGCIRQFLINDKIIDLRRALIKNAEMGCPRKNFQFNIFKRDTSQLEHGNIRVVIVHKIASDSERVKKFVCDQLKTIKEDEDEKKESIPEKVSEEEFLMAIQTIKLYLNQSNNITDPYYELNKNIEKFIYKKRNLEKKKRDRCIFYKKTI